MEPFPPNPGRTADIVASARWRRWRRDTLRLARLMGRRGIGITIIVLLALFIWFNGAWSGLIAQRRAYVKSSAEFARIRALSARRPRIEAALREDGPQYEAARHRGLAGTDLKQAAEQWQADIQGMLTGQGVTDVSVVAAGTRITRGGAQIAALELSFHAVPEQLLAVVDAIKGSGRLERVAAMDVDTDMSVSPPQLRVRMRIEAAYLAPFGTTNAAALAGADASRGGIVQ